MRLAGTRALAQWLLCTSLVAPQHVEYSWIRDQTHVPCTGRWILTTVLPGNSRNIFKNYNLFTTGEGNSNHSNGTPLQYFCLENSMDGEVWRAAVHGVPKSRTRLSDFTFTFHFHALEKEMATHSSVLAWRIPGMAEPGGLPSLGSHRVGHD